MKIEAGKFYRTECGKKVRIYSTQNYNNYSVHGAVLESENTKEIHQCWLPCIWKDNGNPGPFDNPTYQIVGEWQPPKIRLKAWINVHDGKLFFNLVQNMLEEEMNWVRAPWLDEPDKGLKP